MFMALACTVAFAQTEPGRQSSQKSTKSDTVTVTGCVAEGSGGHFMLNNATTASDMKGGTTSGTSGSATSAGATSGVTNTASYMLMGGDNLKAHVGHKVEVTGTLSNNSRGGAMSGGTPSGGSGSATSGGAMSGSAANAQELRVQSVKMVSATCP